MPQVKETAVRKRTKKPSANVQFLHEDIAAKAYELYELGGREDGKDVEHWLEAERLLAGKKKRKKSS